MVVTESILNEYIKVLEKIDTAGTVTKQWSVFIARYAEIVPDKSILKICRDPFDDMFVNCALLGKVNYIISGDNDLLVLKQVVNIPIIKPSTFLKLFKEEVN